MDVAIVSRGAAAGHVGDAIVFTNISSSACTVTRLPDRAAVRESEVADCARGQGHLNGYLGGLGGTGANSRCPW